MPAFEPSPGVRLAFADAGPRDARPVVLLHGWSTSSGIFDGLARALAARPGGIRVIAPDLRGHGDSAPARFGLEDLATDLAALVEALGLTRIQLAGWSLGGMVALAALPRIRARVSSLALLSTTPRFTAAEGWPHGLPAQAVDVLAHRTRRDHARALARFFDDLFAPGELDPAGRERCRGLRARLPLPHPDAAADGLAVLATADLRPSLAAVDVPALVLHGGADPICPAGAGAALASAIRGARLATFPGAGHAFFLSHEADVAGALGTAA